MFYSTGILAKKASPLSKIWLAAHWSKKLTKQNIFDTDIEEAVGEHKGLPRNVTPYRAPPLLLPPAVAHLLSVPTPHAPPPILTFSFLPTSSLQPRLADAIITPTLDGKQGGKHVPLALRVSGHLLVGLCRIYQRKVAYLLHNCNDAETKIKMAAHHHGSVNVDLDEKATLNAGGGNDINVKNFGENFELEELDDGAEATAGPARDLFMATARVNKLATARATARREDITLPDNQEDEFEGAYGTGDVADDWDMHQNADDWDDDMGLDKPKEVEVEEVEVKYGGTPVAGRRLSHAADDEQYPEEDPQYDQFDDQFDDQYGGEQYEAPMRRESFDDDGLDLQQEPAARNDTKFQSSEETQQPGVVEDGDIEVHAAGSSKAGSSGGGAKKRKQAAAFDEDEPTQLSDAHMKACMEDTKDITNRKPLRRRFVRIGEEDPLSLTMEQRFHRPTMQGLAPALMKMYEELMTPGMFPFAQAKAPLKRAAEDDEPEEAGGADVEAGNNSVSVDFGRPDENELLEEHQQDADHSYNAFEDDYQQDDYQQDEYQQDGEGRRRSSFDDGSELLLGEGEEEEMPPLEDDEEAAVGSQGGAKRMHRHQRRFLRLLDEAFAKQDAPTFQKIVPKKSVKAHDAARLFHELLVAKTKGWVEVQQDEPNGNIFITKMAKTFDRVIETEVQPAA